MKINSEALASFITIFVAGVVTFIGVVFFPEKIMDYFLWVITIFFGLGIVIASIILVTEKLT